MLRTAFYFFSISILFYAVLFYSILAKLGLSVENWLRNGVFQWETGPKRGLVLIVLGVEPIYI
jgi:hypothetical protein